MSRSRKDSMTAQLIYYRAGKDKRGAYKSCARVVLDDPARKNFKKRLRTDETFRTQELRWTKKSVDEYLKEYDEKATCPGPHIHSDDIMMCTHLYERGYLRKMEGDKIKIENMDSGRVLTLNKNQTCSHHETHDLSAEDMPDDVCNIKAFGEAALLLCMKKRFIECLNIYTYVNNIVLCLNPYMYLPRMVDIKEYPEQESYERGKNPNTYATATFAYMNSLDKYAEVRNNCCIVSGESGAGKTVACSFIIKYLAKLSDWRKKALREYDEKAATRDISKLVGGVSPFLELFGNAKTNMNDNSSRFGKFTKVWFNDGKIVGAELVHYLLEKSRISHQGAGERNYHIFYALIRGATGEERKKWDIKTCDEYPCLVRGGSSIVGHGHGEEYDVARLNNPLHDDPDETGARAALRAASFDDEKQARIWNVVISVLKLLDLGIVDRGTEESPRSEIKDADAARDVDELLGLGKNGVESLSKILCIFRFKMKGQEPIDKPLGKRKSEENRDALAKEIYNKLFAYLINEVCNTSLHAKEGTEEVFVGLLDIFGFEVMAKNSIEQLCINFANEKLQLLFNNHVFKEQEKIYEREGLNTDVIPDHQDNKPCCDLVEAKSKHFVGILGSLDDATASAKMTDIKFLNGLKQKFGTKKKKENEVYEKAGSIEEKRASRYFYGHLKKNYLFSIVHYASDVQYDVRGFINKNKDKLPVQLSDNMKKSNNEFLQSLFHTNRRSKKHKRRKTLASGYLSSLQALSRTLTSCTPNYVRCVKPNSIHFTPVDGYAAFDEWKTYRQLLYAGVMEVVKIMNEGYPYRMNIESFWDYCVENRFHKAAGERADADPRSGIKSIARLALLPPASKTIVGTDKTKLVHFWTLGKTLFFSKSDTIQRLKTWQQGVVSSTLCSWWRYQLLHLRLDALGRAAHLIGREYRDLLVQRRLAGVQTGAVQLQARIRSIMEYRTYVRRCLIRNKSRQIKRAYQNYFAYIQFVQYAQLCRIRTGTVQIKRAVRNYIAYIRFERVRCEIIRVNTRRNKAEIVVYAMDLVKNKVARRFCEKRMVLKLRTLRSLCRVQALTKRWIALNIFSRKKRELAMTKIAAQTAHSLYKMVHTRRHFVYLDQLCLHLHHHLRMKKEREQFLLLVAAAKVIQRFRRTQRNKNSIHRRINCVRVIQRFFRFTSLRSWCMKRTRAALTITRFFQAVMARRLFEAWKIEMTVACRSGNSTKINDLLNRIGKFERLWYIPKPVLASLRDSTYNSTFIHRTVESGSVESVDMLRVAGCALEDVDFLGNTPFHLSCQAGDRALAVSKYLYVHSTDKKALLSKQNVDGQYPCDLVLFCDELRFKTILWLLEMGANASPTSLVELEREVSNKEELKSIQRRQRRALRFDEVKSKDEDVAWKHMMLSLSTTTTRRLNLENERCSDLILPIVAVMRLQKSARRYLARKKRKKRWIFISNSERKHWLRSTEHGDAYFWHERSGFRTWDDPHRTWSPQRHRDKGVPSHSSKVMGSETKRGIIPTDAQDIKDQLEIIARKNEEIKKKIEELKHLRDSSIAHDSSMGVSSATKHALSRQCKKVLLKALMIFESGGQDSWYYIDGTQRRYGPFNSSQMTQWKPHFHRLQHVSRKSDGHFAVMNDIFDAHESFHLSRDDLLNARETILDYSFIASKGDKDL